MSTQIFSMTRLAMLASLFYPVAQAEEAPMATLDEVVVSAPLEQQESKIARPVTVLTKDQLLPKVGSTIGATLQQELGVNNQSFGPGVGAPVIRGQSGPRVRVMQNGIGNNDASALSPDHANSVEPVLADRIEVLRGPSTLLYGSGAIGGVVNVIDGRIPEAMPDKPFNVDAEQRYDTVADETNSLLKLGGGKNGVVYNLDGFYRGRGNVHIGGAAIDEQAARESDPALRDVNPIQNSYGVINNTQAHAIGGTAGLSYVGDAGFVGASINRLNNNYGIPPDGTGNPNVSIRLEQTKYDFKSEWKQPFALADALRLKFGYTDYRHQEFEGGVLGTTWTNQTYESRLEMPHQAIGPVKGVIGFQSINSDFQAFGEEAIVPKTFINTYGLFAVEAFDYGPVTYEFGARVEHHSDSPDALAAGRDLPSRNFLPVSGSATALYKINDQHQVSLAFTQSQRAPAVQELYGYGVHHATRSFEIGNPFLNKEISYNLDLGYRLKMDWVRAEVDLFNNWVNDYIYQYRTGELFEHEGHEEAEDLSAHVDVHGAGMPVMETRQGNAVFKGFESRWIFPLMENRHGLVDLTLFGDYTRGEFVQGGDVPRMPPLRYGFQLDYAKDEWSANVRLTRGGAQDNPGDNETRTPGYLLLNVGAQYQVKAFDKVAMTVFAKGNNLLNENIRNSTSYLRNYAPEPGRGALLGLRLTY